MEGFRNELLGHRPAHDDGPRDDGKSRPRPSCLAGLLTAASPGQAHALEFAIGTGRIALALRAPWRAGRRHRTVRGDGGERAAREAGRRRPGASGSAGRRPEADGPPLRPRLPGVQHVLQPADPGRAGGVRATRRGTWTTTGSSSSRRRSPSTWLPTRPTRAPARVTATSVTLDVCTYYDPVTQILDRTMCGSAAQASR